jgi:hypothetical protein
MRHLDEAKELWAKYVPQEGQADTKQGELIRAVEKLRHETMNNGNMNWDDGHRHFVEYLRTTLASDDCFTAEDKREIEADLDEVGEDGDGLPDGEGPYDRLADRVVEWNRAHPEPVPHEHIPDLDR